MMTPTNPITKQKTNGTGVPVVIAITMIFAAGCASTPAPTEQIAASKAEVTRVLGEGGNEYAPLEMKSAMSKIDSAEREMAEGDFDRAKRLAEQAQLDAKLAETKTSVAKAEMSVAESEESNRVLREEIKRITE